MLSDKQLSIKHLRSLIDFHKKQIRVHNFHIRQLEGDIERLKSKPN